MTDRVPVFVHSPRTGGRSIRVALGMECDEIHLPVHEIRRREAGRWAQCSPFTFVRNPWDRAVSIWAFLHRHRGPEALTPEAFRDWVGYGMLHPSGCEPTLYARTPYAIRVTAPQLEFIGNGRTPEVGWIGRHEHIQQEFARLTRHLGVNASLHHLNRVPRPVPPAEYYDEISYQLIAERYRWDALYFGYQGPSTEISGPSGKPGMGVARAPDLASHRAAERGFRFP